MENSDDMCRAMTIKRFTTFAKDRTSIIIFLIFQEKFNVFGNKARNKWFDFSL